MKFKPWGIVNCSRIEAESSFTFCYIESRRGLNPACSCLDLDAPKTCFKNSLLSLFSALHLLFLFPKHKFFFSLSFKSLPTQRTRRVSAFQIHKPYGPAPIQSLSSSDSGTYQSHLQARMLHLI